MCILDLQSLVRMHMCKTILLCGRLCQRSFTLNTNSHTKCFRIRALYTFYLGMYLSVNQALFCQCVIRAFWLWMRPADCSFTGCRQKTIINPANEPWLDQNPSADDPWCHHCSSSWDRVHHSWRGQIWVTVVVSLCHSVSPGDDPDLNRDFHPSTPHPSFSQS